MPVTKGIRLDLEVTCILSGTKARPMLVGMDKSSGRATTSSCHSCCSCRRSAIASIISSCKAIASFRRLSLLVSDKDAARMVGVTC
jgi:hypothetical protein